MADTTKNNAQDTGNAVANAAKDVGKRVATAAEDAVDLVKEKTGMSGPGEGTDRGVGAIADHMDVIASCGKKMGVVDHVEGGAIKLTKNDSPDGQHHFVPVAWVDRSIVTSIFRRTRKRRSRIGSRMQLPAAVEGNAEQLRHCDVDWARSNFWPGLSC